MLAVSPVQECVAAIKEALAAATSSEDVFGSIEDLQEPDDVGARPKCLLELAVTQRPCCVPRDLSATPALCMHRSRSVNLHSRVLFLFYLVTKDDDADDSDGGDGVFLARNTFERPLWTLPL